MTKLRKPCTCKPIYRRKKINKLFAGLGSVRIAKNCDLGRHFQFFTIRNSQFPPSRQITYRRIKGSGREEEKNSGKKMEDQGGGRGKRTPAIKTPIGSFLRSLAAAKF